MDNLEWYTKVDRTADDILLMIKNRNNPDFEQLPNSAWFETEEEAKYYAFDIALKTGKECKVYHRNANPDSIYNIARKLLRKDLSK